MKKITIFAGCACNCEKVEGAVKRALDELGVECEVEKIMDAQKTAMAGVYSVPALAVDGKVKVMGRVPKPEEVRNWLSE